MTGIQIVYLIGGCTVAGVLLVGVVVFLLWATSPIRRMHP